jgi:hypothetical protein
MFYISEIQQVAPATFKTDLQKLVYDTFSRLNIPFERVDTDEAITMDDCTSIDEKLGMNMVKTLFLCNRQQTDFYLFITKGGQTFQFQKFQSRVRHFPRVVCFGRTSARYAANPNRGSDSTERISRYEASSKSGFRQ